MHRIAIRCLSSALIAVSVPGIADDELQKRASWSLPSPKVAETQVREWLSTRELDGAIQRQIDTIWSPDDPSGSSTDLLSRVVITIGFVDPRAQDLVKLCRQPFQSRLLPALPVLNDQSLDDFALMHLRLFYARWLAQHGWHDEVLLQLTGIAIEDVVDPASLLFYRATAEHILLKKEACLKSLSKLLENETSIPHRYATVARLLEADSQNLQPDSLDEVARLMNDIRRRLQLGRTGKRVRTEEDEVIAKLDKMIKNLEEQQQQQQQQQSGQPQNGQNAPQQPAPDSAALPGSGPGNVDPRKLGENIDWGRLPPKERQATLQRISEGLPAHFREVIEAYFKKIASQDD